MGDGVDALLSIIDDLSHRVDDLYDRLVKVEAVVNGGEVRAKTLTVAELDVAGTVKARRVVTDHLDVWASARDEAPMVTMDAVTSLVRFGDGHEEGPHVDIDVGPSGSRDSLGRLIPDRAGIYLCGAEDETGVQIEAAVGQPGRSALGCVRVLRPAEPGSWPTRRSVELADGVLCRHLEVSQEGGGQVNIDSGDLFASLYVRAKMTDEAPTLGLHAGLENLDERGRDLGEAQIVLRQAGEDSARLAAYGTASRSASGELRLYDEDGVDRVTLQTEERQAKVRLWSPSGDAVDIDAGPEGAAVAVRQVKTHSVQWLDKDGLRPA